MNASPPWRRFSPRSPVARFGVIGALAISLALLLALVALPFIQQLEDARARAARLDLRAAALTAAAADRRDEARIAAPGAPELEAATAWLDEHAPEAEPQAAMLDLLSAIRRIAAETGVELNSTAPLETAGRGAFAAADMAGLAVVAAEARIVADHAGLARFLAAIEAARPRLRAATLEINAASALAPAEARRLTASVVIGALHRPAG